MQTLESRQNLSSVEYWKERAKAGYSRLGWVNATEPLNQLVQVANLRGDEIVMDAGTGSQAVKRALTPHLHRGGRIFGFDISSAMLTHPDGTIPDKNTLFMADACKCPIRSGVVDLVTIRQVIHNFNWDQLSQAFAEFKRILKPGGRVLACEYVTPDIPEAWEHEFKAFDIKEPGRNLWTGPMMEAAIQKLWHPAGPVSVEYGVLAQNSVQDWLSKSGIPQVKRQQIIDLYLQAGEVAAQALQMTYTKEGDILVDRPFAYVTARKDDQ